MGIFVNAQISAFTNMTKVLRFVNADISAFTNIHILSRFVNADISAFSALTRYEFNKIILSKLHYTCIFNRLDFKGYYNAYDSTFYGRLF